MNKRQWITHTNTVLSSTQVSIWQTLPINLPTRGEVTLVNQGVSNDLSSLCQINIIFRDALLSAPVSSSDTGLILNVGDSVTTFCMPTMNIYYKSTTTNASLEQIEIETRIE